MFKTSPSYKSSSSTTTFNKNNSESFFLPGLIQRKKNNGENNPDSLSNIEKAINSTSGKSLDNETRAFMEPRFGYDFSKVRIHDDDLAHQSSAELNALAYTSGNNIVFSEGQFSPGSESGKKLLGHELAHVVQQSDIIRPYRNKKAFNFGMLNDATLIEDSFNYKKDKETKPWIELVTVEFTSKKADSDGNNYWVGTASAKYYDNIVKFADFTFSITGGSAELGKTDKGDNFTVHRIEGVGYNSGSASGIAGVDYKLSDREGPNKRYSKDLNANMSFAVFYHKGEALHAGPLDYSSHGCVHVDWNDYATIKQLNYHSVIGHTKVKVKYP